MPVATIIRSRGISLEIQFDALNMLSSSSKSMECVCTFSVLNRIFFLEKAKIFLVSSSLDKFSTSAFPNAPLAPIIATFLAFKIDIYFFALRL